MFFNKFYIGDIVPLPMPMTMPLIPVNVRPAYGESGGAEAPLWGFIECMYSSSSSSQVEVAAM